MRIQFIRMGINGEGIGFLDSRKPVFCDGVLPGETAEVSITEEKDNYARADLLRLITPSPDRIASRCTDEEIGSGACLSIMRYEAQLAAKKMLLEEALWKYAHINHSLVRPVHASPSQKGYRSACKLPVQSVQGKLMTGMYQPGSNHFVPVNRFAAHTDALEHLRLEVLDILNRHGYAAYDAKTRSGLRFLILRSIQSHHQVTLVTGNEPVDPALITDLMKIRGTVSLTRSINTKHRTVQMFGSHTAVLGGRRNLVITLDGLELQLAPESFFQLNVEQAENLYRTAVDKIDHCHILTEAYCGIGAMSLMAAGKADTVIGIESVAEAVDNATENAIRNHIMNVQFACGDAADGLLSLDSPNCLLVDPPRTGLDDRMLAAIADAKIRKIIYISCNPATLGKNLHSLKHHYQVRTVIPFDMFPDTPHVESVTVLERG